MSYTRTVANLRGDIRRRGEFRSPRPTDPDVLAYMNETYAEFYDLLIEADQNRFATEEQISVVAGTGAYAFPADHLVTLSVAVADSNSASGRTQIRAIDWQERNIYRDGELDKDKRSAMWTAFDGSLHLFPTPTQTYTAYHQYAPVIADATQDSDTYELVSGLGREWFVLGAMIRCGEQEEQDVRNWEARQVRLGEKIKRRLKLQKSEPRTVYSVYAYDSLGRPARRR